MSEIVLLLRTGPINATVTAGTRKRRNPWCWFFCQNIVNILNTHFCIMDILHKCCIMQKIFFYNQDIIIMFVNRTYWHCTTSF